MSAFVNPTSWAVPDSVEIIALHGAVTGIVGTSKPGCVESAIGAAITACVYAAVEDDEADLICLAAYALTYLARNQCFADGNKRIAWSTLIRIFDANDMRIIANEKDAADFTNEVAEKRVNAEGVMAWLLQPGRLRARTADES